MSHTATEDVEPVEVPDDVSALTEPTFQSLEPDAAITCDRHSTTYALVRVTLASGLTLELCGNCGRRHFGFEHTKHSKPENRQQGSDS